MCPSIVLFAAGEWSQENGVWTYYNENGQQVMKDWIRDGSQWYWVDETGTMAADRMLQIEENYYYFKTDGSMASNEWMSVADENGQHWYYFQEDGSACKNADGSGSFMIDGKQYSFDAQGRMVSGWVSQEDAQAGTETRSYYRESGELVTSDWVKDGDCWYWMDETGTMASDKLVKIGENYYYFRKDGTMVSEEWVGIPNKDAGKDGEPEKYWYYFQKNGKAYKGSDSSSSGVVRTKTINGKKYAFDMEGRMLYGWVYDGERQDDEDAWSYSDYYFGTENDGAMRQGWERLEVNPDSLQDIQPGEDFWKDVDYRWFYFTSTGKKVKASSGDDCRLKTINGNRYGFDEYGRMIASWYADPNEITLAANRTEAGAEGKGEGEYQGQKQYTKKFMYFGSPEAGARYVKGWFRAMPSEFLMKSKYSDDDGNEGKQMYDYYADERGHICAGEIKTIDKERYAFSNYGQLITGLACLKMEDERTSKNIEYNFSSDATEKFGRGPFGSEDEFNELVDTYAEDFVSRRMRFYFFGGTNGAMLTGKQMVSLSKGGSKFEFMFETDGRYKGCGVYGKKNNKLYKAGKLMKAGKAEKFVIVKQTYETLPKDATQAEKTDFEKRDLDGNGKIDGILSEISVKKFISEVCNSGIYDEKKDETVWTVRYAPEGEDYYLIDTSGNIVKNRTKAKNEDGFEFYVKDGKIRTITAEN